MIYTSKEFAEKFLTQDQIKESNVRVEKILNGEELNEELETTQELNDGVVLQTKNIKIYSDIE